MKTLVLLSIMLYIPSILQAQQENSISIEEQQSLFYSKFHYNSERDFDKLNSLYNNYNLEVLPLTRQVFGWNPYWMGTVYTTFHYSLLSTIAYFSYEVDTSTGSYTTIHFWDTTALVQLAHANNVRVVLTATNFGLQNNTAILGNLQRQQTLIDSLKVLVIRRGADGVNIDFEKVPNTQRQNLVTFMTSLTSQFHSAIPNSKVSIDLPAVDTYNGFDVASLNNACDYMIMLGYDYHSTNSANAGPGAPLQSGSVWGIHNVTNSINLYLTGGVSASKLLLGVPYYGWEWPTVSNALNSQTTGTGIAYRYSSVKTRVATYGRMWDANSLTPWYDYQNPGWFQGWYDDSVSLGLKFDFVNTQNLGGIGIWALGYDAPYNELWNTIAAKFGAIGIRRVQNITEQFSLSQNYPNPFNPTTKITLTIPPSKEFGGMNVALQIFDALGREISTLIDQPLQSGLYTIQWDGTNYPSGLYFYKLEVGQFTEVKKMVLVK